MKYLLLLTSIVNFSVEAGAPDFYVALSNKTEVPVDILLALASVETDVKLTNGDYLPWPYSINLNGNAERYSTSELMISRASQLVEQGVIHFDCGLFQVNWKWNGRVRANSLPEACNPESNGIIAATIIKEYFVSTGSWVEAAGKYHNPANKNGAADRYKKYFKIKLKKARRIINGND